MSSTSIFILTDDEVQQYEALPQFNERDREFFFTLNDEEQQVCDTLGGNAFKKVHFILFLGFYKAKKKRFTPTWGQVQNEIDYIYKRYFPNAPRYRKNLDKQNRSKLYRLILKLQSYSRCTHFWREKLKLYLQSAASNLMNKRLTSGIPPKCIKVGRIPC